MDIAVSTCELPHFIRLDFAHATQTVFYVMAGIMAAAAIQACFCVTGPIRLPLAMRALPPGNGH